jgi:hypothetical protein
VFENRVLRRIFGSKRDEVIWEWRKLHNEELNNLCSSPTIMLVIKSRGMRGAGHLARIGVGRAVYRGFFGKHEGKWPLGRPKCRFKDSIKMDVHEVECGLLAGLSWLRIGTGDGLL